MKNDIRQGPEPGAKAEKFTFEEMFKIWRALPPEARAQLGAESPRDPFHPMIKFPKKP